MTLVPNNSLLNNNFETYRVNLKHLSQNEEEVACGYFFILFLSPNFINLEIFDWTIGNNLLNHSKVKAFSVTNNLFLDDFNQNHVYCISKNGTVFKTIYCKESSKLSNPNEIFVSNTSLCSNLEQLPANLFFPSADIACFADGFGYINVIHTLNRSIAGSGDNKESWEVISSISIFENFTNSSLLECRLEFVDEAKYDSSKPLACVLIHCCLLRIFNINLTRSTKNVELTWVVYKYCEESKDLKMRSKKVWIGDSVPEMVTLSNDFKSMQVLGNHSFRFISPDINYEGLSKENISTVACWCNETNDSFVIECYLNIPEDKFTLDFIYSNEENMEITVLIKLWNKEPMELFRTECDSLFNESQTIWNMKNEFLLITLKKLNPIENGDECVSKKAKLLISGFEEVDDLDDNELGITLFSVADGQLMEEISISKNQWLFKLRLGPNQPFSACLRSSDDGLLWTKSTSEHNWVHHHTLNAFGYVAASKVNKKFVSCSLPKKSENGVSFAIITDWKREMYILMQSRKLESNMTVKNRSTGVIVDNVADEFFVTLDKSLEIVGIVANDSNIFVLSRRSTVVSCITVIDCS